jgi:hypothetical protein
MHRISSVLPIKGYKIIVKFTDNIEGIVDLSDIKGKGVFSVWNDENVFNAVSIDKESNTVTWPGGIDLCPDVLYAEVTGKSIDSIIKSGVGV